MPPSLTEANMVRTALIFGALAGLVVIGAIVTALSLSKGEGVLASEWLGYLVMILALSLIFFGVKRYRDQELGGVIKFVPAFLLGLGIAAVAGAVYVVVWEVYLALTDYAFMEAYVASVIEAKRAEGVSGQALEAFKSEMQSMKDTYANPLFRLPMTFLEIFPVGLLIALVSAALLRNPKLLPARG
jgi:hypothetical protein